MKNIDFKTDLWAMNNGMKIPIQFMTQSHIENVLGRFKHTPDFDRLNSMFSTELVSRLNRPKPIYHAHPMPLYNTSQEERINKWLNSIFVDMVVCPNKDIGELGGMLPYLMIVRQCEMVVASENGKYIARGTYSELEEARKSGIPAFVVRKIRYKYKLLPVKDLRVVNNNDWKYNYGRIITY